MKAMTKFTKLSDLDEDIFKEILEEYLDTYNYELDIYIYKYTKIKINSFDIIDDDNYLRIIYDVSPIDEELYLEDNEYLLISLDYFKNYISYMECNIEKINIDEIEMFYKELLEE